MKQGKDLRAAVIGIGRWGKNHLGKAVEVLGEANVAFYDRDDERRRAAAGRFPLATVFPSWEAFLASDWPAAIIASPAVTHAPLVSEALDAGKDVLVEKPLALDEGDAEVLVAKAESRGSVLMVGHILLYDPAFVALKGFLEAGGLGKISYLTAERAKLGTIRTEEDAFFSLAAHDVAAAVWLVGEAPVIVTAGGVDARGSGLIDAGCINAAFPGGTFAHIFASWLYPISSRRFAVIGDKAMATVLDAGANQLTIHAAGARQGPSGPEVYNDGHRHIGLPLVDPLTEEIKHFIHCVENRIRPRSDGRQGLAVVRTLAAAQTSARAGGTPVSLEPLPLFTE